MGTYAAMRAGARKMPLPIVEPTSTATALHRPSRRISRSPQRSPGGPGGGGGIKGADIRFANYTLTLPAPGPYSARVDFSPGGTADAAVPFGPAHHCALAPRLSLQNRQVLRPNDAARRQAVVHDNDRQPDHLGAGALGGPGPTCPGRHQTRDAAAAHCRLESVHALPDAGDARERQRRGQQQSRRLCRRDPDDRYLSPHHDLRGPDGPDRGVSDGDDLTARLPEQRARPDPHLPLSHRYGRRQYLKQKAPGAYLPGGFLQLTRRTRRRLAPCEPERLGDVVALGEPLRRDCGIQVHLVQHRLVVIVRQAFRNLTRYPGTEHRVGTRNEQRDPRTPHLGPRFRSLHEQRDPFLICDLLQMPGEGRPSGIVTHLGLTQVRGGVRLDAVLLQRSDNGVVV